jgi:hypothetical protein
VPDSLRYRHIGLNRTDKNSSIHGPLILEEIDHTNKIKNHNYKCCVKLLEKNKTKKRNKVLAGTAFWIRYSGKASLRRG